MYETITCPKCKRRLQLPVEHMDKEMQCPSCEARFVADDAKPRPPSAPNPEAISVEPALPPSPAPDAEAPRSRRSRRLDVATPAAARKSNFMPLLAVLGIVGFIVGGGCCLVNQAGRQPFDGAPFVNLADVQKDFNFDQAPPPIDVPERMLNAEEQKEQAKIFFAHFSAVMRNQNNAGEMAAFDASRLLATLWEQKLIPDAWAHDPNRPEDIRRGVLLTSIYRGEHWVDYEIKTVKQLRVRELIVVTRHPNRMSGTAVRLRWWLAHREGRWRIQEMEDLAYGMRLSLLLAAGLPPDNAGGALVRREIRDIRDAFNAIVINANFADAERILGGIRADNLPKACAATHLLLLASIRFRQQRAEETLASCDAAQRCQADLPGSDYLRSVAFNNLHRAELALKNARLAQEWYGDDPVVDYEMGLGLHGLGRVAEAAGLFRKVLDDRADNHDAFLSLLRCGGPDVKNDDIGKRFLRQKNPRDHFEEYAQDRWNVRDAATLRILAEAMSKLEPRHADAHFYVALAHAHQQRVAPALTEFRAAVAMQNLNPRLDYYYTEFAKAMAFHDHALEMYAALPDGLRSFRALGEALKNSARMDDLRNLIEAHVKKHPQDECVQLFQAELHLRDEQFELANQAFSKAFAAIKDLGVQDRFHFSRVRARYQTGDVFGAYRDIGPQRVTFQQLAASCWIDKKTDDLVKLTEAHAKNDADDPGLARPQWRVNILTQRFAEAGKIVKSALGRNPLGDADRYLVEDFLLDTIDAGQMMEGYKHAPDPGEALEIIVANLAGMSRAQELQPVLEEHRKRFPDDPILLVCAAQQAAAKQDWAKAAQAYSEGWKKLPDAKRLRWSYGYLHARFKEGQAIKAYHETGKRPEHFRQLANLVLRDKQTDMFERLLNAHAPQRADDPEFATYEARLKILRGRPAEAAEILRAALQDRPLADQSRISDSFLADLGEFNLAVETYLCIPDKLDAFAHMAWKYRNPERVLELERLIAEHAKHHPDDPRLVIERAELHMLRSEFAQAEKLFLLARNPGPQNLNLARFGLIRARIKLGKAAEAYHELGASTLAFNDVANQCVIMKDGAQLERVLAAHRQAFPAAKNLATWDVEIHWLKKDYEATVKVIQSDRTGFLKSPSQRWKCQSYLVRSLVRLKKPADAVREAETINQRKDGPQILLALALASTGDVPRVLDFLDAKKGQRHFIDDCYHDEDLGPILRSDAYRKLHERFPPPSERKLPNERFDDWD